MEVRVQMQLDQLLEIQLKNRFFVPAAKKLLDEEHDSTNYNAIWLRDSMWAYLALKVDEKIKADNVLKGMVDYLSSSAQLQRLNQIIENPDLAQDQNAMHVIHIRFNSESKNFDDVYEDGKPQYWNHKQNDALGLFYLCWVKECIRSPEYLNELPDAAWEVFLRLPTYFEKIKFYEMEDAGSWEEIERTNTSSIALVTSALEKFEEFLLSKTNKELCIRVANRLNLSLSDEVFFNGKLNNLIDKGYEKILGQLPYGESPLYPKESPKYRTSDAALLNLIYPAELKRLSFEDLIIVLKHIQPLIGEVGIKRYISDAYQAAGYWQNMDKPTHDYSGEMQFVKRAENFIQGTEAQWFFDSWAAIAYAVLFQKVARIEFKEKYYWHLDRALRQVTSAQMKGADGRIVAANALPESYNVVLEENKFKFVPSPITPLNWAKASLKLALNFKNILVD